MRPPSDKKLIEKAREGDLGATYLLCRRRKPPSIPALVRLVYPQGGLSAASFDGLAATWEEWEDRTARLHRT